MKQIFKVETYENIYYGENMDKTIERTKNYLLCSAKEDMYNEAFVKWWDDFSERENCVLVDFEHASENIFCVKAKEAIYGTVICVDLHIR